MMKHFKDIREGINNMPSKKYILGCLAAVLFAVIIVLPIDILAYNLLVIYDDLEECLVFILMSSFSLFAVLYAIFFMDIMIKEGYIENKNAKWNYAFIYFVMSFIVVIIMYIIYLIARR